ncbi:MAG: ATP-dependent DNA ligase, partial [Candidatus Aenigmarchaeota archaeon]|nr:ATP-dependent DNA ligase [Candidatus Aenigmarchaeota archaeon]
MDYAELVEVYEHLEKTSARLEKIGTIAKLMRETPTDMLPRITLLLQGKVFPSWSEKEVGIADLLMVKIVSKSTGFSENEVLSGFKKTGDFGLVIEDLVGKKKQKTLFTKPLTVEKVFENLRELAVIEGKGSQERKFRLVSELISSAEPKEAKYIVRTTLGDLRIGVAEGVIRDSIARAFFKGEKEEMKEAVKAVEWAWFLRPDYGEVAKLAKEGGLKALKKVGIEIGKPYHVLLAEKSPSLKEALESFEKTALEYKYDGARIIIHKKGNDIWLYTRRLENVTKQFPELIGYVKECVKAGDCVIEGEMLGFDGKTGRPMPFQFLSQRIKRKYEIEKVVKEIPIQVNLFDIVYLNGDVLFDKPLEFRRKALESIIKPKPGKFQLAKQLVTKDLKKAEKFYEEALKAGQEGLIVKNLEARYRPGRRVGYWLKVKPTMENLDLVIIGAQWGTGKRVGWVGSLVLGCRRGDEFLECGMIGTGIKEKEDKEGVTFTQLTKLLKPHIESEKGRDVKIKPKVVVEVAYEEIQ